MPGPTLGDTYRVFIKPSLDGRLVIRKRTTRQTSARVEASKKRIKDAAATGKAPAKLAHDALVAAGKCSTKRVYIPGKGYEDRPVCPIKLMRSELSKAMRSIHGK